jgi:hypothetical protein
MIQVCIRCKVEKEESCFNKKRKNYSGVRSICKDCKAKEFSDWNRERRLLGLCLQCGTKLSEDRKNLSNCLNCSNKSTKCKKRNRVKHVLNGKCMRCGKETEKFISRCCYICSIKSRIIRLRIDKKDRAKILESLLNEPKCGICGALKPSGRGDWHIDHDHETNRFRAILCYHCNLMLGCARDNKDILIKGASYIDLHKAQKDESPMVLAMSVV